MLSEEVRPVTRASITIEPKKRSLATEVRNGWLSYPPGQRQAYCVGTV